MRTADLATTTTTSTTSPDVSVHDVRDVRDVRETKLWYALLGRSALALLFTIFAFGDPYMALHRFAILFAVYALADGALAFLAADRVRRTHAVARGRLLVIDGVVGVVVAVVAVVLPHVAALRIVGGLRAVAVGGTDAVWSRGGNTNLLIEVAGFASIILGLVVLAWPGPATVALPWLLGLPALVYGASSFAGTVSELLKAREADLPARARTV